MNTDVHPYAIIDSKEEILIPGETAYIYVLARDGVNADDWRKNFGFTVPALISSNEGIKCHYSYNIGAEEIRRISDDESIYKVPINISCGIGNIYFHTSFMYNYLGKKKIAYPIGVDLSVSTGHIGDEIVVTCNKPIFDVETFTQAKLKQLEEINYCPVFVKKHGDIHARVAVPIENCKVSDEYHISFHIPTDAVSGQVLLLNEGGIQNLLPANLSNIEELCETYINFNSTSCEKYAYYASRTELLILDASGDRVD